LLDVSARQKSDARSPARRTLGLILAAGKNRHLLAGEAFIGLNHQKHLRGRGLVDAARHCLPRGLICHLCLCRLSQTVLQCLADVIWHDKKTVTPWITVAINAKNAESD